MILPIRDKILMFEDGKQVSESVSFIPPNGVGGHCSMGMPEVASFEVTEIDRIARRNSAGTMGCTPCLSCASMPGHMAGDI